MFYVLCFMFMILIIRVVHGGRSQPADETEGYQTRPKHYKTSHHHLAISAHSRPFLLARVLIWKTLSYFLVSVWLIRPIIWKWMLTSLVSKVLSWWTKTWDWISCTPFVDLAFVNCDSLQTQNYACKFKSNREEYGSRYIYPKGTK